MNYSLSIWEEKETKRYPSIFWFIVCVLIFAVQNITSIRRRPKLFLGVGLPLLKRRSKWETHFKALTALFSFSFFKCEPESILSLNIRIDMLTEPDGFSVHFCCFHPFLACVKESTSSVNKLNRMSIVWVSVKWFDIELSWRAAMLKFFGSRFFFTWRGKKYPVMFYIQNETKRWTFWNSIVTGISNSILIWSSFLMDATFFLLYLFLQTLLTTTAHTLAPSISLFFALFLALFLFSFSIYLHFKHF